MENENIFLTIFGKTQNQNADESAITPMTSARLAEVYHNWPEFIQEHFDEYAGKLEYYGGMPRHRAEYFAEKLALNDLQRFHIQKEIENSGVSVSN